MSELILIAAVSENNVIGNRGKIPWSIPEDMKRFKELTIGYPVIMGRKTYESIPEKFRPLHERTNIVISRAKTNEDYAGLIIICGSVDDAVREASQLDKICYVAGGSQIYEQTISLANRLEITEVHRHFEGDKFFPQIATQIWNETFRENHKGYSFVTYIRNIRK